MSLPTETYIRYSIPRDMVKVTPGDDPLPAEAIGLVVPSAGRVVFRSALGENRAWNAQTGQQLNVGVTHVFASAEVDGTTTTTTASTIYALIP